MNIYALLKEQNELVYKAALANDSALVAAGLRQIRKLTQRLMIKRSAHTMAARAENISRDGLTTLRSYARETQADLTHDLDVLPQAMEGEMAKGAHEDLKQISAEFGKMANAE